MSVSMLVMRHTMTVCQRCQSKGKYCFCSAVSPHVVTGPWWNGAERPSPEQPIVVVTYRTAGGAPLELHNNTHTPPPPKDIHISTYAQTHAQGGKIVFIFKTVNI